MEAILKSLQSELQQQKAESAYYRQKFEEERLKNEELHETLGELRKKFEKLYNSTEMEEEMIVNKVRKVQQRIFFLFILSLPLSLFFLVDSKNGRNEKGFLLHVSHFC